MEWYSRPRHHIRLIKVLHNLSKRTTLARLLVLRKQVQPNLRNPQRRLLRHVVPDQRRRNVPHPVSQRQHIVVRQRSLNDLGQCPDDLPVFSRGARGRDSCASDLRSALGVYPRCAFFSVRGCRKTYVCELRADVSVVALVDDKCACGDRRGRDVVSVEKVDELGCRFAGGGGVANVVCGGAGGGLPVLE
jgi:hypothetical protein